MGGSFLKPWFWPATRREVTTWNVRLGRVLHWLSIIFAAGSLVLGAFLYSDSERRATESATDIATWQQRHPNGAPPVSFNSFDDPNYQYDAEPYRQEPQPIYLLIAVICAFVVALVGRGARYILGSE